MASFNKVILLGNLTRDPQLRYLPSQTPVVDFGMACNRKFKTQSGEQRDETTFVECSAFGRTAEIINQYCQKGNMLFVEGRLRYEQWEDKQGGGKRSKLSVHVENVQLMPRGGGPGGGAAAGAESGENQSRARPAPAAAGRAAPEQPEPPFGEEQQFREDDIPF
ncbi:MAG: single-stranded DNA-binding protein [Tepidisphaeraceae bacterium]